MKQFVYGFIVASVLWLGLLFAQSTGSFHLFGSDKVDAPQKNVAVLEIDARSNDDTQKKVKKRRGRRGRASTGRDRITYDTGQGESGDEIGAPGLREVGMGSGGEEQLSEAEIDRGIDRVFKGIERCLVLVPADAPATGKVTMSMQIAPSGQVAKVNLKGPKTIVGGEAGVCIRRNVKSVSYRSFDGPAMVVTYPITFD